MKKYLILVATFCVTLALLGVASSHLSCSSTPATGLREVEMPIGKKTFTLEIADNLRNQQRGLMYRESLPADRGMIFVFSEEEPRAFWMANVKFPLDILFLDKDGTVVSISQMKEFDEHTTPSGKPAKYAIELNRDAAHAAGVNVGDRLSIPATAQHETRD